MRLPQMALRLIFLFPLQQQSWVSIVSFSRTALFLSDKAAQRSQGRIHSLSTVAPRVP